MNWFAIGGGIALIIIGIDAITNRDRAGRLPTASAVTLGLVGLLFLYLGAAPGFAS
jgi:hypothetical protein